MRRIRAELGLSAPGNAKPQLVSADTFGSGPNPIDIDIDFVDIGNAGNAADDTGYGAVAYAYRISKYEVSESMIASYNALTKFSDSVSVFPPALRMR